jgi:hypothetical protein
MLPRTAAERSDPSCQAVLVLVVWLATVPTPGHGGFTAVPGLKTGDAGPIPPLTETTESARVLPGQRMIRLSGEPSGGAACLDGSDYAFYVVPRNTSAFSIAIHGGGWCGDEVECAERTKTSLGSSKAWNLTECWGPPGFNCYGTEDCTMVFMPYCDGSSFTGHRDGTWPVPNSTRVLTFRGKMNFERTVDILIRDFGLGKAKDVMLSGGSAGGLSTFLKLDRLQERLPSAKVVGMPVAGYFADLGRAPFAAPTVPHYPDFPNYHPPYDSFGGYMKYLYTMHNSSAGLHSASGLACQSHYNSTSEEWKCSMAPFAQAFVTTPFFSVQSRFDEFQIGPGIAHVPCEMGQAYAPPYRTDPAHVCNGTEQAFIVEYGANFLEQFMPVLESKVHGCFLVSCIQHGINARLDNLSLVDAFIAWRTKSAIGAEHGYHFVDDCGTGGSGNSPCNTGAGCAPPHILKTEDTQAESTTAAICASDDRKKLVAVRGQCPFGTPHSIHIAGVNIFDVWSAIAPGAHTCCDTPHGPHAPCCTKGNSSDAMRALEDLQASGIQVFRFFAELYGAQMKQWIVNENEYWTAFDSLVDEVERLNLYAIPSLGYCLADAGNAAYGLNETINDCMRNVSSVGFTLELKYYRQLVQRYAGRRGILLWELGNELNNLVNLPPGHTCGAEQCFNTSEMVALTTRLVSTIKTIDPVRPISSGFSMPRPAAWHMEHRRGTSPEICKTDPNNDACYWAVDTEEQWTSMLKLQNSAVDIWSVHHYDRANSSKACDGTNKHTCADCYFDKDDCANGAKLTESAAIAAKAAGKVLYQGEYGGASPTFTGPTAADVAYPTAILGAQVKSSKTNGAFVLSTIWAWECVSQRDAMVCIWPNSTNANESGSARITQEITEANRHMEQRPDHGHW